MKLGEICEIISGTSYGKNDLSFDNNGIRIIRGGNINDKTNEINFFDDDVFVNLNLANSLQNIRKNDILIVASTGSDRVIGKPAFVNSKLQNVQIGAFLRIVRVKKEFVFYIQKIFMSEYYREHLRNLIAGTNIFNIKSEYLENFLIPLPPKAEQEFIASELEKLLNLCKNL